MTGERDMHFFRHFILLFCILTLTGCAGTADLFAYTRGAAQFDLLFPSVSGDTDTIVCACSRDGTGNFTLTVTEPARLSGFTAELRDGRAGCRAVCRMDGTEIPLSDDAAAGLIRLFTILTEEGSVRKTSDGTSTVITTPTGEVILNEALLPEEIEISGRKIGVEWKDPSP